MTLFGALAGIDDDATCGECGCPAYRHTPCCGCCLDCGDVVCPSFDPNVRLDTQTGGEHTDPREHRPGNGAKREDQ